nr:alpha-N-acetylgalactosaminide alpha-2,6-sialyltransferase 3-like [Odocoileus virginianus texanus]
MACILKRKSVIAVSFIAAFLFLLVVRLVNEVNFPLLLNCFGQPGAKWIPFSYTYRRPLRTHYGYINVRTQETLSDTCLQSAAPSCIRSSDSLASCGVEEAITCLPGGLWHNIHIFPFRNSDQQSPAGEMAGFISWRSAGWGQLFVELQRGIYTL